MKCSIGGEFWLIKLYSVSADFIIIFSFILKNVEIDLKLTNIVSEAGMRDSVLMADNEPC